MPDVSFKDLCIDVTAGNGRPAAVAAFWSAALDQPINDHDGRGFSLDPPEGGESNRVVWFCEVPEPITGKSRVHIDIRVADGDPTPLLAAGATSSFCLLQQPDCKSHAARLLLSQFVAVVSFPILTPDL